MTGEVKDEKAVAQFRLPVEACADIAGSPRDDHVRPAGNSERDEEASTPTNPTIVAVEQWLCLLLGFTCMGCGGWGICVKYSLDLSSGYISWLGSAYGPTSRLTAVACLVLGSVLVRLGLARPDLSSVSSSPKGLRPVGRDRVRDAKVFRRQTNDCRLLTEMERKELT
jgi:hypothetical protein